MLAHQGGWDELLLPLAAVGAVLAVLRVLGRRRRPADTGPDERPTADACAYCGAALEPDAARCGACGFRVER